MSEIFENLGHSISDCDGDLRDIGGILDELEGIESSFSIHSMNTTGQAFLQGKAEMLNEVIQYLRRV